MGRGIMFLNRFVTPILALSVSVTPFCIASSAVAAVVAPVALPPGATVTSLPNGDSSYPADPGLTLFDDYISFDFDDGLLSGILRERVLKYSQVNEFHPYGDLYFDYEITLSSGDISAFNVAGYAPLEVAVKQCGISNCGGSGANGALASSATRSADGDWITYFFEGDLVGGAPAQIYSF